MKKRTDYIRFKTEGLVQYTILVLICCRDKSSAFPKYLRQISVIPTLVKKVIKLKNSTAFKSYKICFY